MKDADLVAAFLRGMREHEEDVGRRTNRRGPEYRDLHRLRLALERAVVRATACATEREG